MFKSFLANVAHVFLALGRGAAKTALFISDHPDVVARAGAVAIKVGAPADKVAVVDTYATKAGDVASGVRDVVNATKQ